MNLTRALSVTTCGRRRQIGVCLAIQLSLIVAICAADCRAEGLGKPRVLKDCASLFGAPVDAQADLFEVNQQFVLQPRFDARGNLQELAVLPKYFLEETHPDWTEPDRWPLFSAAEYQALLNLLENLSPKGPLVAASHGSVITNSTGYYLDQYEHGFVNTGRTGEEVRFFNVYPFHEIEGVVKKKQIFKSVFDEEQYQVVVGELVYFIKREQYLNLQPGKAQRLMAVGPVKGICYAGFCN